MLLQSLILRPLRWVFNFQGMSLEEVQQYPVPFRLMKEKVYPQRQQSSAKHRREFWWLYTSPAEDLYRAVKHLTQVLVTCFTSKYVVFAFVRSDIVFANTVVVIASEAHADFAVLQSAFHENWVQQYSSTLETRQRYALSDCYETFAFPVGGPIEKLSEIGREYYDLRSKTMLAHQEGLTATYNRFHNSTSACGHRPASRSCTSRWIGSWPGLRLGRSRAGHGFHETAQGVRFTIDEAARREVLGRCRS